jgi:NAD(P)-dependent dehydrogenase (short-subunit alcohol dehydrogenase family)
VPSGNGRRFDGKVALITGAARGQGAAHARRFAAEGAAVVLTDVLDEPGEAVAAELRDAGHDARYVRLDVRDAGAWETVVADVVDTHGGLNVLVNNAGVSDPTPVTATSDELWQRIVAINQTGVFLGMRTAIPAIVRSGGGAVVNISSVYGVRGSPGYAAYHASKAAVLMMTRAAAADHAHEGVRVNAICPGLIMTPMVEAEDPAAVEAYAATIPMGRGAEPDEISNGVLFLASDEASFVTGASLVMDGGWLAR